MTVGITFSVRATTELQDAYDWYEGESAGLGKRFLNLIDQTLKAVQRNPSGYPCKHKNYREIVVRKFPFVIIYEISPDDEKLVVLSVFHTKRTPLHKYGDR